MSQELVKIDPKEYDIEETKAADIAAQFKPMLDKMVELEVEYNEVINLPKEEPATAKKAREVRLKYMKVRTGTLDIHKLQKAFYLAGGRFVDGWKNAQHFASLGKEEKLEEIENYAKNIEKQRISALQLQREEELAPFEVENLSSLNLGLMADNVWENFFSGSILSYNYKKQAEQEAIAAKTKRLEEEAAKRKEIRIENEKLKKEAIEREKAIEEERKALEEIRIKRGKELQPFIVFIRDYNNLIGLDEKKYRKELADILKGAELQWELERKEQLKKDEEEQKQRAANIEAGKQRKIAEEAAAQEKIKREALEAELEEKKDAELKAEANRQAAIEAELTKGDADKMLSLIEDLNNLTTKYSFKSKKHKTIQNSINELIAKTVVYAKSKL